MQLDSIPHRRQPYLPQAPQDVAAGKKPTPTTWEDATHKKLEFEKAVKAYDKTQKQLAKDRELVDKTAHEYYHAIPITDSTLYSECPFSPRRVDFYMSRSMYKLSEKLFRWMAPRTMVSVTEIKTFLEEMLPAAEWGMKMKTVEDKLKAKDIKKIGPESEELF